MKPGERREEGSVGEKKGKEEGRKEEKLRRQTGR